MMMVPTRIMPMALSGLLGWGTKLRMGLEWFRKPIARPGDRSVAEFIREHYGPEAVDYLAEPLLAGVYGGDPEALSAASVLPRFVEFETTYGSLTRGTLAGMAQTAAARPMGASQPARPPLFRTLKRGLGSLVETVQSKLDRTRILTGAVEAVEAGGVRVNGEWIAAGAVVLACPAHAAAKLVPIPELAGIPYSSSMTVALGYRRDQLRSLPKGFGFLVPARERKRIVACTFVGAKFAHRVPEGRELLRCFLGGASDEAALSLDDGQVRSVVLAELREILGLEAQPEFVRVSRWPRSMAQYTVGHAARIERIREAAARLPWLHLTGNAYTGIGIPDCIALAKSAAARITSNLPA
jgi:oxygen-dependent protoporphyrinogen oxidase